MATTTRPASIILGLVLLNALLMGNCHYLKKHPITDEAIARAGETYLYRSQLQKMMAQSSRMPTKDSSELAQYHIQQWLMTQLLTATADTLPLARKNAIEQQVVEYRQSLLRYEAEQQIAKTDTILADTTIDAYYRAHATEWLLKNHMTKVSYMVIYKKALDQANAKKVFFTTTTDTATDTSLTYLNQYCTQYAYRCALEPRWLTWNELSQLMPLPENNTAAFIKNNNYETRDSLYTYRLKISERAPAGTTTPLEYCRPQIRDAILHHHRIENIQQRLQQHYQEAQAKNIIEIY